MKSNRWYIYLLICGLICLFNFLKEWEEGTVSETFLETIVLLPVTFLAIYLTHFLRKKIKAHEIYQNQVLHKTKEKRIVFWAVVISIKTLTLSLIIKIVSEAFFNNDVDEAFFDPGFWITFTATFLVIVFVYALEIFFESQKEKRNIQLKLLEYEAEKSIAKYLAIKKQLNPHFLFNSFNSLMGLISMDVNKAENFVEELSKVYRYNLTQSEEIVVSLQKEIQMIQSYIYLQKIRFGDNLIFSNEIDSEKMHLLLPPMTLELLVENAIKHNIVEKTRPLKIIVYTIDQFVCVTNNYQPKNSQKYQSESLGIGLKNLRSQLKLLSSIEPSFKIIDNNYVAKIPLVEPEV